MLRDLDPSKVPGSCEQCGKTELLADNLEVWELIGQFSGLLRAEGLAGIMTVDYRAAEWVFEAMGIEDVVGTLEKLEAICRGLNQKR